MIVYRDIKVRYAFLPRRLRGSPTSRGNLINVRRPVLDKMRHHIFHGARGPNPYKLPQTEIRYKFAGQYGDGQVVVDVACGPGIGTQIMRSLGAKTCIGLDHYLPTLRSAAATYSDCSFACCDAIHLCLPDDSVDVVVSCETIEHFDDPARFVAECARVLRPGGLLICSTPNHTVYRWDGRNPFHVHEMNVKEFRGLFEDLFTDIELYGQWQVLYPAYVLKRILRDFPRSFRIKSLLKRAVRHGADRALVEKTLHPEFDVRPYTASLFVKPMYLVAVARKPLPVGARQAAKT